MPVILEMSNCTHKCSKCGSIFTSDTTLKEHYVVKHFYSRFYLCRICGKTFENSDRFDCHTVAHTREMHSCSICGVLRKNVIDIYIHLTAAHKYKYKFVCDICTVDCTTKFCLKEHILNMHKHKIPSIERKAELYCSIHSTQSFFADFVLDKKFMHVELYPSDKRTLGHTSDDPEAHKMVSNCAEVTQIAQQVLTQIANISVSNRQETSDIRCTSIDRDKSDSLSVNNSVLEKLQQITSGENNTRDPEAHDTVSNCVEVTQTAISISNGQETPDIRCTSIDRDKSESLSVNNSVLEKPLQMTSGENNTRDPEAHDMVSNCAEVTQTAISISNRQETSDIRCVSIDRDKSESLSVNNSVLEKPLQMTSGENNIRDPEAHDTVSNCAEVTQTAISISNRQETSDIRCTSIDRDKRESLSVNNSVFEMPHQITSGDNNTRDPERNLTDTSSEQTDQIEFNLNDPFQYEIVDIFPDSFHLVSQHVFLSNKYIYVCEVCGNTYRDLDDYFLSHSSPSAVISDM